MNFLSALRSVPLHLITNFTVRISGKVSECVMYIARTENKAVRLLAKVSAALDAFSLQLSSYRRRQAGE